MSDASSWPRGLVFDLDGTLIDSAPDLAAALNLALKSRNQPELPVEKVRLMIGAGVPKLIERGFAAHNITLDTEEIKELTGPFLEYYDAHATDLTTVYPDVVETLKKYADSPVKTGICTNKPTEAARIILQQLGIDDYIDVVMGGTSGFPKKPDPQVVHACIREMGCAPEDCLYVGDSETDVLTARNAGLKIVVLPYGYTSTAAADLGADGIIQTLAGLPEAIEAIKASA